MNMKPNEHDWMMIANDFRRVLGIPELKFPVGIPTDEQLSEYDKVSPGFSDKLRQMAEKEMKHRQEMCKPVEPSLPVAFMCILIIVGLLAYMFVSLGIL